MIIFPITDLLPLGRLCWRRFIRRYCLCNKVFNKFLSPQANDLYGVWGNPDLKPEKADSWEVGLIAGQMRL